MDYIIIIFLQFLGIALLITQKMIEIDKRSQTDGPREVFAIFLKEDWITLLISGVVLLFNLIAHYIVDEYTDVPATFSVTIPVINVVVPYIILAFGFAFFLGYGGQWLIFRALGKTKAAIDEKFGK